MTMPNENVSWVVVVLNFNFCRILASRVWCDDVV